MWEHVAGKSFHDELKGVQVFEERTDLQSEELGLKGKCVLECLNTSHFPHLGSLLPNMTSTRVLPGMSLLPLLVELSEFMVSFKRL